MGLLTIVGRGRLHASGARGPVVRGWLPCENPVNRRVDAAFTDNPQEDRRRSRRPMTRPQLSPPARPATTAPLRALVVDDEPHISDLLATALRYEGFEPTICDRGGRRRRARRRPASGRHPARRDAARPRRLRGRPPPPPARAPVPDRLPHRAGRTGRRGPGPHHSAATTTSASRSASRRSSPGSGPCCAGRDRSPSTGRCGSPTSSSTTTPTRSAGPGVLVELTQTEYSLLRLFLENPRRVLSRPQILDRVWRYDFEGNGNVVDLYVGYLRRKLDPLGPPLLRTVRGVGYVLRAD